MPMPSPSTPTRRGPNADALVKIEHAVDDLRRRGVSPGEAAPLVFRQLWRLGVPLPPPHFLSTRQAIAFSCTAFLLLGMPLATAFAWLDGTTRSWAGAVSSALVSGAVFGLFMAERYGAQSQALGMPSWAAYVPNETAPSRPTPE